MRKQNGWRLLILIVVFFGLMICCAAAQADITTGLISYYPFNGNANDESGNGHNGIVNSATLTTDRNGNTNKAYNFDGVDDYINLGAETLFAVNNSFTVSVWFKTHYLETDEDFRCPIISNYEYYTAPYWGIYYHRDNSEGANTIGKIDFSTRANTSPYYEHYTYSNNRVDDDLWHCIVAVRDVVAGKNYLYLDGILNSFSDYSPNSINSGMHILVGTGGDRILEGNIDDIRIYSRALSASEVEELYGGYVPPTTTTTTSITNLSIVGNYNLANIGTKSDEFQLWLDVNGTDKDSVCDDDRYYFQTYDASNALVAEQLSKADSNPRCKKMPNNADGSRRYRIWFTILPRDGNDRLKYFENGTVKVFKNGTSTSLLTLNGLNGFSVYGTGFDITRDAYKFRNGEWTWPYYNTKTKSDTYKALEIIDDYIFSILRMGIWDSFGYDIDIKIKHFKHKPDGACYGMTNSIIANFNHQGKQPWGLGEINSFKSEIEGHWDQANNHALPNYKPYEIDDIYNSTDGWTIQSAKKIMYYYAAQSSFDRNGLAYNSNWVGHDKENKFQNGRIYNEISKILKNGSPISFGFRISDGGHSVAITQAIWWDNHEKYIIWDNDYPYNYLSDANVLNNYSPYMELHLKDASKSVDDLSGENYIIYVVDKETGKQPTSRIPEVNNRKINFYHNLEKMVFVPSGELYDSQNIYNMWSESSSWKSRSVDRGHLLESQKTVGTTDNFTAEYDYQEHVRVSIIGAGVAGVFDNDTKEPMTLLPYGEILSGQAVIETTTGGTFNFLYLPADKLYKIVADKPADSPGLKVFVQIPFDDGTVEIINYENLSTTETDPLHIYFYVGRVNTDKSMHRTVTQQPSPSDGMRTSVTETAYPPDYDSIVTMKIIPPENFAGVYAGGAVNFTWQNPAHADFAGVTVLRKEGAVSESVTDGIAVYTGAAQAATDAGVEAGKQYYYAAYAFDSAGRYSEPAYLFIDTTLYSITGTVKFGSGTGVNDALLELVTADNSSLIGSVRTGSDGTYVISGVDNGTYTLKASHDTSRIENAVRTVEIDGVNIQELFTAEAVPVLTLLFNVEQVYLDNTVLVQWTFRNIDSSKRVELALNRDGNWETLADNVTIVDGRYSWPVTGAACDTATLSITLKDDNTVFAQHVFAIKTTPVAMTTTTEPSTTTTEPSTTTTEPITTTTSPDSTTTTIGGASTTTSVIPPTTTTPASGTTTAPVATTTVPDETTTTTAVAISSTTSTADGGAITTTSIAPGSSTTSSVAGGSTSTTTTTDGPCPASKVLGSDNPRLENLRGFRDSRLAQSAIGRKAIQIYYTNADSMNAALERSPALRAVARRMLEVFAPMAGR